MHLGLAFIKLDPYHCKTISGQCEWWCRAFASVHMLPGVRKDKGCAHDFLLYPKTQNPAMDEPIIGTRDNEMFLDKKVVVHMRDGKYLYGIFRSFDQFSNITLENATERIFFENMFSERKVGLHIIRGESIVFIGIPRLDLSRFRKVDWDIVAEKLSSR